LTANATAGLRTPLPKLTPAQQMALEVERQFREIDAGSFFVQARVVRRVVQNQLEFASPLLVPPHRKSCVVDRDRLLWLVARDELGIDPQAVLPKRVILLARPEENQLEKFTREDLLRYYWRLLFHARIDFELESAAASERLPLPELRRRIAQIGQTQFDEIRSVLHSEQMLRRPDDPRDVYCEFVAVYHELRAFAPDLLPLYFPSLDDEQIVLDVIGGDCDAAALLAAARPVDISAQPPAAQNKSPAAVGEALLEMGNVRLKARSPRRYAALVRRADRLRGSGNNVRAALVRRLAFDRAPLDQAVKAQQELLHEVEFLVLRLQAALELSDESVRPWLTMCQRLLPAARHGFWNANARLLFDLQQVCLDHEKEMYRVDLLGWTISGGRRPLKRPLPNHRVVLMSKHLHRAAARVGVVQIDDAGRKELSDLLHAAAEAAEHILRRRLEPQVAESVTEARFIPGSVVERVAFRKMNQELLDRIIDRGFLTLGDLRDAISRNELKAPDLSGAGEFFAGDPLLTADRLFAAKLDGVYQRGPFYLRWLQRGTSLAFGVPFGRALTKYLALPFGLAYLGLMAVEEVAQLLFGRRASSAVGAVSSAEDMAAAVAQHSASHQHLVYSHLHLLWVACAAFALLHFPVFRGAVVLILNSAWKLVRGVFFDLPRLVFGLPAVAWFLRSFPMLLLRRFVLGPAFMTALVWWLLPALRVLPQLNRWWALAVFIVSLVILNSRVGRDTQELTREFLTRTVYRIRVHFVVGLVTFVIDGIRWLMDGLERVLYAVDEWLRFRTGESGLVLAVKAVVGLAWSFVHGVIRFCVTLLIEPQINPIKHFPVVTVSHKLVLGTLAIPLASLLETIYDKPTALTIAGLILTGIPGVFGFLAWELKENWKLYAANRSATLRPVRIGHHGETLRRLLVPGFHSGTIPKFFGKRRRAARAAGPRVADRAGARQARFALRLNHEAEGVRHFVERELIALLAESRTFRGRLLMVERVDLANNRVSFAVGDRRQSNDPVVIQFCEQSGRIVAGIKQIGWLSEMPEEDRNVFRAALAGFYKRGAAGLVREQIESHLVAASLPTNVAGSDSAANPDAPPTHPYDIADDGLIVWPYAHFEAAVRYSLEDGPNTSPRPRSLARAAGLAPLPLSALVFEEHPLSWSDWRAYWDTEQNLAAIPVRLLPGVELLRRE
jgi:hypothetical protein